MMKKSLLLCVVLCLGVSVAFAGPFRNRRSNSSTASVPNSTPVPAEDQKDFDLKKAEQIEKELLVAINVERERYGLRALVMDHRLQQMARRHCAWMGNHGMIHSGYACAENIAMGQPSTAAVVQAWMNSSGHRANILNRWHLRTGVACYVSNGTLYWCQQFLAGN
jgi:uncharacterized protein YkwD